MTKANVGHFENSGVQVHSAGDTFPAIVVCIGGFPTSFNDYTAEVLYRGIRVTGFNTHNAAERFARKISQFERESGKQIAKDYCIVEEYKNNLRREDNEK